MKNVRLMFVSIMVVLLTAISAAPALAQTPTPVPPVPRPAGSTEITFWYGLGGTLGNSVLDVVNLYNSSQSQYYVSAVFQASYDDTINKINAGLASGELPNVAQIFEAGTQRMIDSGRIIPVQELLERDGMLDVLEDMEPAVRANYEVDGVLFSAPFNSSTAMLYINRAAFIEAGLNPDEPLVTYDDVANFARALTVRDANGTVIRHGLGVFPEGWFLEQIHAVHDTLIVLPDNGRQGERATSYAYNGPVGVQWVEFLKGLVDEGVAVYFGTGGGAAANAAFVNNQVAMNFSSIAVLRGLIASAEQAGQGVDVGVLYMPRDPGATGKTIVGGASLWITDVGTTEQQEGAWDFVKFTLRPDVQAFFAAATGYYPVVRAGYDLPEMQAALEQYPQFQVAIDQIRMADITDANTAHVSGIFVPYRTHYVQAFDRYFTGGFPNAQAALDSAVAVSNELLAEYNLTVGR